MREPISFELNQRLRLGLVGHDRAVPVDVVAVQENTLWVHLAEPVLWLEDHHLEGGIDVIFWDKGARHLAEHIHVSAFDLDRGRLQIERPLATKVIQRRKTFRETVELQVLLSPVELGPETKDIGRRVAITEDLGGGGLSLQTTTDAPFEVDDEIQLELALPDRPVRARGRVCWTSPNPDGTARLGVAFTRIAEHEQDSVYGFLFDIQRSRSRAS